MKRFKEGRELHEDDPREGAPGATDKNVDRLRTPITYEPSLIICTLSDELEINKDLPQDVT